MRWQILTIGKPKLAFAKSGVTEYLGRLNPDPGVTFLPIKPAKGKSESESLLHSAGDSFLLTLDPNGIQWSSEELASHIQQWQLERTKTISVLIGGADGHSRELLQRSNKVWSLSKLTLQHELALLVCLEQIYRAFSILSNSPYHRGGKHG